MKQTTERATGSLEFQLNEFQVVIAAADGARAALATFKFLVHQA